MSPIEIVTIVSCALHVTAAFWHWKQGIKINLIHGELYEKSQMLINQIADDIRNQKKDEQK